MGVEPFLLASTLSLIIAERLVRRICHSCKYSKEYNLTTLKKLMPTAYKTYFKKIPIRLYEGKGCEKCNFTGYKGRVGIFETIYVTEAVQDMILHRSSSKQIWEIAQKEGAVNFFADGLEKVMLGEVSLEELLRVAPVETDEDDVYGKKEKE
jgi:type II secretory ATPase GspE/PulE/Tfp pilus assembly ATPase PilB-like protein